MKSENEKVLVSIITVCYNAEKELPITLESIFAQDYKNFEYIIQDGASKDGSLEIISKYKTKLESKGITVKLISEPDGGIYDAMNKAVQKSEGVWINFMNAGDCFYSEHVLSDVFEGKSYPTSAVLYGDCLEHEYGRYNFFPKNEAQMTSVMPFSHQSMFARRELLFRHPFKTTYKICADYDFILTAHDMELHFADTGHIICITNKDGISSVNYHEMLKESAEIKKSHGISIPTGAKSAITETILTVKQFVLDHFPEFVKKSIRGAQIKARNQIYDGDIPYWCS